MSDVHAPPPSELEPVHILLPLRTVSGGKARLGEALDAEEREELVLGMLLQTLDVLAAWRAGGHIHIVSPDPLVSAVAGASGGGLTIHRQEGEGLNEGIALGVGAARQQGAASLLVLPCDLPHVSVAALEELLLAADAGMVAAGGGSLVAIAPADAGGGTNALLLRPPDVIAPAFGPASFEAHLRAAEAAGAAVQVVDDADIGFDLDTPEDLERLEPARLHKLMERGRAALEGAGV